jgi:hypothetical protein
VGEDKLTVGINLSSHLSRNSMNQETLESLSRKDLQQLAKEHGLKANKKSVDLIHELLNIFVLEEGRQTERSDLRSENTEEITIHETTNVVKKDLLIPDSPLSALSCTDPLATVSVPVFSGDKSDLKVFDEILFEQNLKVCNGKIKRLNKLSVRVILDDGSELTIPYSVIRGFSVPVDNETVLPVVNEQNEDPVSTEVEREDHTEVDVISDDLHHIIHTIEEANDESTICDGLQLEEIDGTDDTTQDRSLDVSVSEVDDAAESQAEENVGFRDQIADISEAKVDDSDVDVVGFEAEEESDANIFTSAAEEEEDANETDQSISSPIPPPRLVVKRPPVALLNGEEDEETKMNVCEENEEDLKVSFLFTTLIGSHSSRSCAFP